MEIIASVAHSSVGGGGSGGKRRELPASGWVRTCHCTSSSAEIPTALVHSSQNKRRSSVMNVIDFSSTFFSPTALPPRLIFSTTTRASFSEHLLHPLSLHIDTLSLYLLCSYIFKSPKYELMNENIIFFPPPLFHFSIRLSHRVSFAVCQFSVTSAHAQSYIYVVYRLLQCD